MPKAGIVIPVTVQFSIFALLAASVLTSKASVESSPPETPTTGLHFVASMRFLSPITCISKISRHLFCLSSLVLGTKGSFLTFKNSRSFSFSLTLTKTVLNSLVSSSRLWEKVLILSLSARIFPKSISAKRIYSLSIFF